jgi:hypothetical protein
LRGVFLEHAEERALAALAIVDDAGGSSERAVDGGESGGPRDTKAVARAGADKGLEDFAVDSARVDAFAHLAEGLELSTLLARAEDGFNGHLADPFDRREPKANHLALPGRRESDLTLVDIGRQDLDPHRTGFVEQNAELVSVAHVVGHQRAEKFPPDSWL